MLGCIIIFPNRKEKNKSHRGTSGKRNPESRGNLFQDPFRKLVPHPLLRYPCLALHHFTLHSTNCFPRNEIKGRRFRTFAKSTRGVYEILSTFCTYNKGKKNLHPFRKIFRRDSTQLRRINIITRQFSDGFSRGSSLAFWRRLIREQATIQPRESANWKEAPSNHRLVTSRQR